LLFKSQESIWNSYSC